LHTYAVLPRSLIRAWRMIVRWSSVAARCPVRPGNSIAGQLGNEDLPTSRRRLAHHNRGVCLGGGDSVEGGALTPESTFVRVRDVGVR